MLLRLFIIMAFVAVGSLLQEASAEKSVTVGTGGYSLKSIPSVPAPAKPLDETESHQRNNLQLKLPKHPRSSPKFISVSKKSLSLATANYIDPNTGHKITVKADEVLIRFHKGQTNAIKDQFIKRHNLQQIISANNELEKIGFYHVRIPKDKDISKMIAEIKGDANIEYAETNPVLRCFDFALNDPNFDQQWALKAVNAEKAWNITEPSPMVIIAVIDSGVELEHPDLLGNLIYGHNFLDETQLPIDDYGHGTQVAGIIAARKNNSIGICGLAYGCRIMPLKVLDGNGEGTCADVARAIIYAADNRCKVINLSLGTYAWSEVLKASVDYAAAHDCIIVAAAGNDGTSEQCYPAALPSVISVAATDRNSLPCSFGNRGDYVDVTAPGKDILTTTINCGYESVSGTSAACAYVSGLAGLAVSADTGITAQSVRASILYNVQDAGEAGWKPETGMGAIDCAAALSGQEVSDIDIGVVGISTLPANPLQGQDVIIRAIIRNHGTFASSPIEADLKYQGNIITSASIPSLEPKHTAELHLSCKAPLPDRTTSRYFAVCVKPLTGEAKTDDNTRSFEIVSTSSPIHDIAIQNCQTAGAPLLPGVTVTVSFDVVNLGNQPEENIPLEFFCQSQQIVPTRFISLPPGGFVTVSYDWQIPSYAPCPNDLSPVYFLSFRLGELLGETNTTDNRFDVRLGFYRKSDSVVPLHLMEEGTEVHQWIALEAYDYFVDQITGADISAYIGSISTSQADNRNNLIEGTAAEDKDSRPPLSQTMPYLRHFCAGADGSEIYNGFTLLFTHYDSALEQAQKIWPYALNAYAGNKPLSFYYLGHVAHLLADMTVPAHVHNDSHVAVLGDPDEYEETIGHDDNYKLWYYGGGRSGDWLDGLSLPADLTSIFYQTANFTEDYDSGDYDGDGPPYYFPSDCNTQWHLPNLVDRAGGISTAEVTIIGDDLMPYAMRRTTELYRLFYKTVDTKGPLCTITYPVSGDQNEPDYRTSTASFSLIADGNDLQSGVLKASYHFSYAVWTGESWSAWTDIVPSPTISSVSFTPPSDNTLYAFSLYIWNGAGAAGQSHTKYLFVDSVAPQTSIIGYSDPCENNLLVSGTQYPYPTPHFHFLSSDVGSGLNGYYCCWGTDPNETPSVWNTSGDYNASELSIGTDYYLRVSAIDKAGNITSPVTFSYKYIEPCIVDFNDLAFFCEQWLSTGDLLEADLDNSNAVDFGDFAIFSGYWLNACPPDWLL